MYTDKAPYETLEPIGLSGLIFNTSANMHQCDLYFAGLLLLPHMWYRWVELKVQICPYPSYICEVFINISHSQASYNYCIIWHYKYLVDQRKGESNLNRQVRLDTIRPTHKTDNKKDKVCQKCISLAAVSLKWIVTRKKKIGLQYFSQNFKLKYLPPSFNLSLSGHN